MFLLEVIKGNAFVANPSVFGLRGKDSFAQNINLQTNKRLEKMIHATLGDGKPRSGKHAAVEQLAGGDRDGEVVGGKQYSTTKGKGNSSSGIVEAVDVGAAGESETKKPRLPKPLNKQRMNQTKVISSQVKSNCRRR
jgi:hypothetical protein